MSQIDPRSYLSNADVNVIDEMYRQYSANPENVDFGWQKFFEGFDLGNGKAASNGTSGAVVSDDVLKEIQVLNLIKAYRTRGHLFTKTNPVRDRRKYSPTLEIANFNLQPDDLEKTFNAGVEVGLGPAKLKDIIQLLELTYCQHIGAEFVYIREPKKVEWLQKKMESLKNTPGLSIDEKRHFLRKLNKAVVFESFLHTKFVGQKRFSLEGLEALIPALDAVMQYGANGTIEEFVIGMAHRGRLNVLANTLGKSYEDIFKEFEGKAYEEALFEGDVKYHLGYSSTQVAHNGKEIRVTLAPNPSHLETVNAVVKGIARAKLDRRNNATDAVLPILIHGDAALAGQGINYEVVQMAGLDGYKVGGTIHIAANNQIGFTTNYADARTSTYCTDVAKVTLCPVFHVNADDVEAVIYTVKLALEYRQEFGSDVFIDLLGYRKYGHNEGDEPRFTQPQLYKAIGKHQNPREIYTAQLLASGSIEADLAKEMEKEFRQELQEKLEMSKLDETPSKVVNFVANEWEGYRGSKAEDFDSSPKTAIDKIILKDLAQKITSIPEGFAAFQKVVKLFEDRKKMIENDSFDWAMGELMAYGSLLNEGFKVRMSGQDCERGTFSHRHAVIKSEENEEEYNVLSSLGKAPNNFEIYNSLLSEYAVMGYEYGYGMVTPNCLTLWEAQFGDFANGAQIVIDQYLASAEAKWRTYNGLVLLLPHGYEGQGPEHSSARLERFLQLCANNNMQVANLTTPANLFHMLRRQLHRDFRTPLVVMTPKSLLRHPLCVSKTEDFTTGGFKEVIDDAAADPKKVKRVVMCSGKIYYDLLARKTETKNDKVALVRVEQLYPYPEKQLAELRKKYANAEFAWAQEEPKNMGAYTFLLRYDENLGIKLFSRKSAASPATGFPKVHAREQEEIVSAALSV